MRLTKEQWKKLGKDIETEKKAKTPGKKAGKGGRATTSGTVLDAQIRAFCESHNLEMPEKEVRFHPVREWRFDYAWVDDKIAVEVEGTTGGAGGRHQRRAGYAEDCEKYTAAALSGWVVIRITYDQIQAGKLWEYIEAAFEEEGAEPIE